MIDTLNYDKRIFKIKKGILVKYRGNDEDIEIPQGVYEIKNGAFKENRIVRNVIIPSSVKHIGNDAFEDCFRLESVTLPLGLLTIGSEAFDGCSNLAQLFIPKSVEYIGAEAFEGFKKTQLITIEGGETQAKNFSRSWKSSCRAEIIYLK